MRTKEIKVYQFSELSDEVKEKVLKKYWDVNVDYEWHESIVESLKDNIVEFIITNIYFSGFYSQGDGAMFEYNNVSEELYEKFLETLPYRESVVASHCAGTASGQHRGHYYHEYCCEHSVDLWEDFDIDTYPNCYDLVCDVLVEKWREFTEDKYREIARGIYRQLKEEYEYRTSEKLIFDTIAANQWEFTEDGKMI